MIKVNAFGSVLFTVIASYSVSGWTRAPIDESTVNLWRAELPYCPAGNGWAVFPSKVESNGDCEDGDSVLFNGLVCAAGEPDACDAVRASFRDEGRWFRSPRRKAKIDQVCDNAGHPEYSRYCVNTFSPDMALGAQLYAVATGDKDRYQRWLKWINDRMPSPISARVCTDDPEKGCTLLPGALSVMSQVSRKLGRPASLSFGFKAILDSTEPNTFLILEADSLVNKKGYSMHLTAVSIYLLRMLGHTSDILRKAASNLAAREPENPFFRYLRDGATEDVKNLVLSKCPKDRSSMPAERIEWSWERAETDQAWKKTMLWDCLFMAKLLSRT